ncbi:hypothetical protein GCM10027290_49450 [Micromonospora sonneratiae]|uniref:YbaB/EbfC family nucleoid-associated protein n=1 Tax=Micromonospora sonneratiae TaxID=1184706 RepID=A0ABW3YQG7_9ACTN
MSGDSGATAERVAQMRAQAEELTSQIRRMTNSLGEVARDAGTVEVTATSGDGLIVATVGIDGRLRALHLDPRIYHQPNAADLARSILETADAAVEEAQRRALELYQPLLPGEALSSLVERDPKKLLASLVGELSTLRKAEDGR